MFVIGRSVRYRIGPDLKYFPADGDAGFAAGRGGMIVRTSGRPGVIGYLLNSEGNRR